MAKKYIIALDINDIKKSPYKIFSVKIWLFYKQLYFILTKSRRSYLRLRMVCN